MRDLSVMSLCRKCEPGLILGYDLQKDNEKFCRQMTSCKAMKIILFGNFEKNFPKCEKMASRNIFRHFFRTNFFMFVLLISNHTVFLIQFETPEIALAEAACAISAF